MRSIGITSAGSSTTQIVARSRLGSAQIRQSGPSERLKHSSQRPTFSFTSRIARRERRRLFVGGAQDVEGEPLRGALADPRQPRELGDQARQRRRALGAHIPGQAAAGPPVIPPIFELGQLLGGAQALVDRRLNHLGEQLGLLGVDRLGIDRDLAQGQVAAHLHLDHAAAGARLDHLVLELLLRLQHLGSASAAPASSGRSRRSRPGSTSCHLTDLLRVELALQPLHQRFVDRSSSAAEPPPAPVPRRQAGRRRAAAARPTTASSASAICSRFSGASALRLLKVVLGRETDVTIRLGTVDPTGRAPSKVAASAGARLPQLVEHRRPDPTDSVEVDVARPAGLARSLGGAASGSAGVRDSCSADAGGLSRGSAASGGDRP